MAERYPVYAEAAITIDSIEGPPEEMVGKILARLGEAASAGLTQPA